MGQNRTLALQKMIGTLRAKADRTLHRGCHAVAAAAATTIPGIGQLSCNPSREMLSTKQGAATRIEAAIKAATGRLIEP
jgi:hypothetical protein